MTAGGRSPRVVVIALALAITTACRPGVPERSPAGPSPGPTGAAESPTVPGLVAEADLYTGRPNPTWSLDSALGRLVTACARTAPTATTPIGEPPSVLGFRGLVVRGVPVDDDPDGALRARPDAITLTARGALHSVRTCPRLYGALRESARMHLSPDEFALIPEGIPEGRQR